MKKIVNLSLIFAFAPIYAGYASERPVQVQAIAPRTGDCQTIQLSGIPLGMQITMPRDQYKMAEIAKTENFAFTHPKSIVLNNEGVKGSCNYYMNSYPITVGSKPFTLNRLVIMSTYDTREKECTNVQVALDISAHTGGPEYCLVILKQFSP